eukprot:m.74901 g.74901  ORF g.74901 m.74901 type:complete len:76 (+) comp16163_c0_seq1:108-335(+)
MPLGFGEVAFLGIAGAVLFLGPKKVLPRIAETMKMARQTFGEAGNEAAAKATKEMPSTVSKAKPPPQPTEVPKDK